MNSNPHLKNLPIFFIILKPWPEVLSQWNNYCTTMVLARGFCFSIWRGKWTTHHSEEDLAKLYYMSEEKFVFFFLGIFYTLMRGKNIWFEYDNFNFLFPWNMANLGKFFPKKSCVQVTTPFYWHQVVKFCHKRKPWSLTFKISPNFRCLVNIIFLEFVCAAKVGIIHSKDIEKVTIILSKI